jgi:1-acyl-sn-glycerol-3-phosphate acyltransferase
MIMPTSRNLSVPLPELSPGLVAMFSRYGAGYLARNFHAVRLSRAERPNHPAGVSLRARPLIVYLNHPSWWDPMMCLLLARRLFPERRHFGPMDAVGLEKYKFFAKLGFFGIEPGTARGARRFLEVSQGLLAQPDTALWITAGGHFADPRERPVRLRPGLGALIRRLDRAVVLPLAVEYPFWDERFPEALARFGEAFEVRGADRDTDGWTALLEARLAATQDALAREALARDPAPFEVLVGGRAGVGGLYDVWRRFRARLRGQAFQPEHGKIDVEVEV